MSRLCVKLIKRRNYRFSSNCCGIKLDMTTRHNSENVVNNISKSRWNSATDAPSPVVVIRQLDAVTCPQHGRRGVAVWRSTVKPGRLVPDSHRVLGLDRELKITKTVAICPCRHCQQIKHKGIKRFPCWCILRATGSHCLNFAFRGTKLGENVDDVVGLYRIVQREHSR